MPIPKPSPMENHATFINRCISDETMVQEYPNNGQRMAICETQWQNNHGKCTDPKAVAKK